MRSTNIVVAVVQVIVVLIVAFNVGLSQIVVNSGWHSTLIPFGAAIVDVPTSWEVEQEIMDDSSYQISYDYQTDNAYGSVILTGRLAANGTGFCPGCKPTCKDQEYWTILTLDQHRMQSLMMLVSDPVWLLGPMNYDVEGQYCPVHNVITSWSEMLQKRMGTLVYSYYNEDRVLYVMCYVYAKYGALTGPIIGEAEDMLVPLLRSVKFSSEVPGK